MTISLATFANGDLDYVSKLNTNFASVESALDGLESMMGGTVQAQLTAPNAFESLFGSLPAVIGVGSYSASISGTDIELTAGFAWKYETKAVVRSAALQTVAFVGATAATYYILIGDDGTCTRSTSSTGAFYSVVWSGSALSALTRIAKIAWGNADWQSGQVSAALAATYTTLDARLEAGEALSVNGDRAFTIVTGKLTKSVAGGANVTLSSTEARNSYFEFTGLLTADIEISFPLASTPRIVNIKNSTTGEFAITCKGSGGTGKKVAQGYSTLMHHDGTNMEYAQDDPSTIAKVVPYAATIDLDWSQYDVAYITLTGNPTINHLNGKPGQKCLLYLEQDTTGGRTVTWGSNVRYGSDIGGIVLTTAGDKVDAIAFSYNWVRSLFNVVSVSRGYDIA